MFFEIVKIVAKGAAVGFFAAGMLMSNLAGAIYFDIKDTLKKDDKDDEIIDA